VAATGEGKYALIYMPILARKDSITLVIQPTDFLEIDIVCKLFSSIIYFASNPKIQSAGLQALGISGLVINAKTLAAATRTNRNLWKLVASGNFRAIMLSPEALDTAEFNTRSLNPLVRN
jgi:hypothetical protein